MINVLHENRLPYDKACSKCESSLGPGFIGCVFVLTRWAHTSPTPDVISRSSQPRA